MGKQLVVVGCPAQKQLFLVKIPPDWSDSHCFALSLLSWHAKKTFSSFPITKRIIFQGLHKQVEGFNL